jgi:GTPase Era involved in 16S rRNA processing
LDKIEREHLAAEMAELQEELAASLGDLLVEIGNKISPTEREDLKQEIADLNELLERLKSGKIWLTVFGKTSTGKSSIINSLLGEDIAKVGVEHDVTTGPIPYDMAAISDSPYMIVDVPGLLGVPALEAMAIEEAKKAHGHIFVIDGEPYQDELELFQHVAEATPSIPKIVFFNKADALDHMPRADAEKIKQLATEKMRPFLDTEDDMLFGSARRLNRSTDEWERLPLPQLEDRLYHNPGALGEIVNVFDPANRAELSLEIAREKILTARRKVARKVILAFALAEAASSAIPFGEIVATPGLLVVLTRSLNKIMGCGEKVDAKKMTVDVVRVCVQVLGALFVFATVGGVVADAFGPIGWVLSALGFAGFKYQRTLVYGEAILLYIENGFSFGDDARATIMRAKENAGLHYRTFGRLRKRKSD